MLEILSQIKSDISKLDRRALTALIYTAAGLTGVFYLKQPQVADAFFGTKSFSNPVDNNLAQLGWWVGVVTVFYFVIPAGIIKFHWKADLKDFGLKFAIETGFWKLLAGCVALMLPLTYLMSLTSGFAAKYPFLHIYNGEPYIGQTLLIWELIYFLQFFGLEFFFRGFLVHSLKPSLGLYSIFAMTMPYCMIHFGKPPAETISAIVAGIFLGWLSYRNGSIWIGLILHCTVAFSMDILALINKGLI
jgi:membrane protease YdiL (CAAX protease family)